MNSLVLFITLLSVSDADWIQVDKSYTNPTIIANGWFPEIFVTCNANNLQYASIDNNHRTFFKWFNSRGFQVRVIFDVFYIGGNHNYNTNFQVLYFPGPIFLLYMIYYATTDLQQQSNRICTGGMDTAFDFITGFTTNQKMNKNPYRIFFTLNSENSNFHNEVGFGNILIYVNTCFPTCATCSGLNSNQCLTCYYGNVKLGKCRCDPQHQFSQTFIGCRQECPSDQFIADYNYVCLKNTRIQSKYSYLQGDNIYLNTQPKYQPFIFYVARIPNGLSSQCLNGPDVIGSVYYNEGFGLQIPTINALKLIRLRVTFYILSLSVKSKITILLDSSTSAEITKTLDGYSFNNAINIFTDSINCPPMFTRIRIETILRTQSLQPVLFIQGKLQNGGESWGFYNVTIDAGLCSEHCSVCSSFQTCQQCESGYILYRKGCMIACPIYSQNCIDYSDEYINSRYLMKGFYDMNMTIEDINSYYDTVTNLNTNFKTGQKFSFFPEKFVLGGVMVWNDASYIKLSAYLNHIILQQQDLI